MQLQFIRNIQFTRLLKTEGRLREFNFRKANNQNESFFSVDVSDDRGNRIIFKMLKKEGKWQIVPQPLPEWIREKEETFNNLIEEELALP
jgi:hypothetical protein